MLLRIFPEQVSQAWEMYAPLIARGLPREIALDRTLLTNILAAILRDEAVLFVAVDEQRRPWAGVLVTPVRDNLACSTSLLVYSLYAVQGDVRKWKDAMAELKRYAEAHGYDRVIGYYNTKDEAYRRLLRAIGGEVDTGLVVFD